MSCVIEQVVVDGKLDNRSLITYNQGSSEGATWTVQLMFARQPIVWLRLRCLGPSPYFPCFKQARLKMVLQEKRHPKRNLWSDHTERAFNLCRVHWRRCLRQRIRQRGNHWNDFIAFMKEFYPNIKTMDEVKKVYAEKYVQYLIKNGKFQKIVSFKRNNKVSSFLPGSRLLSPRTINGYIVSINEIFNLLADDAGIDKDPFANIPKQKLVQDTREAFSMEELKLILQNADDFIYSLFAVGLCTGLREADICLLEWKEIDLQNNLIKRITRKTGKEVIIPIMPPLMKFLNSQFSLTGNGNYVLPEHAEMYENNPSGITWRVKRFLEGLGIKTTKVPKGRTRAVSIKDVHSLRHSFCYYAGLYNVPLAIVQAVVGHMSPEMTKHYTMHATSNDIKKAFQNMPDLFGVLDITPNAKLIESVNIEPERQELHNLADTLPIDEVKAILENIKK